MHHLNYLLASLASVLLAVYIVLWFANPAPLEQYAMPQPPMTTQVQQSDMPHWRDW